MNNARINGIHHVTAIAGDPQRNVDFYSSVMGLRLVKKTVNFDDPYTYHFYFGDDIGRPGTLLTFFPWSAQGHRGRRGNGQIAVYSFSVPKDSIAYWTERLKKHGVVFSEPHERFGEEVVTAIDHDEFEFELVASAHDDRADWEYIVPPQYAIRGFHGITLFEKEVEPSEKFITASLGARRVAEHENRIRYKVGNGGSGTYVDIVHQPDLSRGFMGAGIVHHVAWRTPDDASQELIRERLVVADSDITPVIDRKYFHSIYFHEPGGVLFEVATDTPGFLIDESKESLGRKLQLPEEFEIYRKSIETTLPRIELNQEERMVTKL